VSTHDWSQEVLHDSLGMIDALAGAPEALDAGRAAGAAVELPYPPEAVKDVLICGMGGSGIAGDLVVAAYSQRLRRPVATQRDYYLPGWVGEDTLVVLVSYSGDTEETLTAAMQALDRNSLAVVIASGGKLASFYGAQGVPVVAVPGGMQPRAAILHLLTPLVVVLSRLGVLPPVDADLDEARATLAAAVAAYRPEVPEPENAAKQLARSLADVIPVIYGAEATTAVARRWKSQLNENAKVPAFVADIPEANHNEIVGFESDTEFARNCQLILLRDPTQHRQVQRRFDFTRQILESRVKGVFSIEAEGEGALARVLDLVTLGDYVSLYLACRRGLDPGPVDSIQRLKDLLASTGYGRTATPG
jgi:glucose/mannose-6-phosphate isomerase